MTTTTTKVPHRPRGPTSSLGRRAHRGPRGPPPGQQRGRVAPPRAGAHPQPADGWPARADARRDAAAGAARDAHEISASCCARRRRAGFVDRPLPGRQHRRRRCQCRSADADSRRPSCRFSPRPTETPHVNTQPTRRHVLDRHRRPRRRARPAAVVELADGDTSSCASRPVVKQLGDDSVRMLAYNGSIPGPTLRVRQGSEITVHVRNDADIEATVHWHGLRLDNKYDGVPYETQAPIPIGGEFTYRLRFPDAGLYWYHPHIREDYGLDMGLYGNIVVDPDGGGLLGTGQPRGRRHPRRRPRRRRTDRAVPSRRTDLRRDGPLRQRHAHRRRDEPRSPRPRRRGGALLLHQHRQHPPVQRRAARRPHEAGRRRQRPLRARDFVEEVLLAPSERAIVDVLFDTARHFLARAPHAGSHLRARHHRRVRATTSTSPSPPSSSSCAPRRARRRTGAARGRPAATTRQDARVQVADAAPLRRPRTTHGVRPWTCPMHPEIVRPANPATCPTCGMKLDPECDSGDAELPAGRATTHDTPRHRRRPRVGRPHARDQHGVRLRRT